MKVSKRIKNTYYDSVTLMSITAKLKKSDPFNDLVILMGTEMNKEMIASIGLMDKQLEEATPNDLVLAAELSDERFLDTWVDTVFGALEEKKTSKGQSDKVYKTIDQALKDTPANLAVISVPGVYAAGEAFKALNQNLHVMLFSDNVSVDDEIALKQLGLEKDLLVMGPDCGTAIINGKGLCFANAVKEGNIGLVAASGTGLQEVTVIINRFGGGITQAIGVGGRDLSQAVGGMMMLKGIDVLDQDDKTEVIVLISKPPHKQVEEKIQERLKTVSKPVVVCFLDSQETTSSDKIVYTNTLSGAAQEALRLTGFKTPNLKDIDKVLEDKIKEIKRQLAPSQTKLKGLFCGGTLTAEALSITRDRLGTVTSNVAKKTQEKMADPFKSDGHNLVDLGDDIFTQGKPHPMIEPTIRLERILDEARNPETAVLLLDFELGFGSHEDPVGVTIDTLKEAQAIAEKDNRVLPIVAYVCGTDNDKQSLQDSEARLAEIGVILAKTNAQASLIAARIAEEVTS